MSSSPSFIFTPLGYALGENEVSTQHLVDKHGPVKEGFLERTGFTSIFSTNPETDSLQLSLNAIGSDTTNWMRENLDGIIYVTSTGSRRAPGNSHLLHAALELNSDIFLLDINDACTGFVRALTIANALLATGQLHNILLVLSDTYTKLYYDSNLKVSPLFSDGASAMVLSSTQSHKTISGHISVELQLMSTIFISEGSQADNLTIEAEKGSSILGELSMNGAGVFSFVVKHLRSAVNKLRENAQSSSEITWYVHQGSRAVVDSVEKVLEAPQGSLFRAENYGNVVGSTLPIQIFEDVETFKNNQELGLLAFGVGLTFAGAILKVVK